MTAKIHQKSDKGKLTPLEVTIFESYIEQELKPLKKRLSIKYRYLNRLYDRDLTELSEKERKHVENVENEVSEIYQAIAAYDGLRAIYVEYCEQLIEEKQRIEAIADFQYKRAEEWFNLCAIARKEEEEAQTLLSFLTDEQRRDLEKRRDNARFQRTLKNLGICA